MTNSEQGGSIFNNIIDKILDNLNIRRADSGFNRLLVSLFVVVYAGLISYWGYKLIVLGAKGEFTIFGEFKGATLALWSLSPGVFLCALGAASLIFGLPRILSSFYDFSQKS